MTRITIGTTMEQRAPEIFESSMTVRQVLEQFTETTGVDYRRGTWNINGGVLSNDDMDKTLADLGYDGKDIFLLNVVNSKNA